MSSPSRFSLPSDSRLQPLYPFTLSEHPPELLRMETPARKAEPPAQKPETPYLHRTGQGAQQ